MFVAEFVIDLEMDQAVTMLREAADQGHMRAQERVGSIYGFGWGVAQDKGLALQYYERAALRFYPPPWLDQALTNSDLSIIPHHNLHSNNSTKRHEPIDTSTITPSPPNPIFRLEVCLVWLVIAFAWEQVMI